MTRTAERFEPCGDIRSQEVAHPAIDLVQVPRCQSKLARFAIERLCVEPGEGIAKPFLGSRRVEQFIGIEPGKRLPLAFEHGNHLPQIAAQIGLGPYLAHERIPARIWAAIMSSAIFVGTRG